MYNSYHNSVNHSGQMLIAFEQKARHQDQEILDIFTLYPSNEFTPFDINTILVAKGINYPITSIRRAITNLTKADMLERSTNKKLGIYKVLNYTWRLK